MSKTIVILIEDFYQDLEVWYPYLRLKEAGHEVWLVGMEDKTYTGKYGYPAKVDKVIDELKLTECDAVLVPGGFAPDLMRKTRKMIDFVAAMHKADKLVAAICHGVWIPASANILRDQRATCYFAIADDIKNAGAHYSDEPVVIDGNLITARKPDDLPEFCKAILHALEG